MNDLMHSVSQLFSPQYPRAVWRCIVNGADMAEKLNPRLSELTLTECRGDEADQISIVLTDYDGLLELPELGAEMSVAIGWSHEGLVEKGDYTIDELEYSGAPDIVTIRGRSADLTGPLRTRTERSFHKKTIAEIVRTIAEANELEPVIHDSFTKKKLDHIDQTNESDLAFLKRIGKRHDAVATVKEGRLLFMPISSQQTASGEDLPTITLTRQDGDRHSFQQVQRDAYTGVRAFWLDTKKSKRKNVVVGVVGNAKQLRETYSSEVDALEAARSEWARIRRGASNMRYSLAVSRPELSPQYKVKFENWKPQITEPEWLVEKVTHRLDGNGLACDIELELVDN